MMMSSYNPFIQRESYGTHALTACRLLAPLSWALVVVVGIFYSIRAPDDVPQGHTIFKQFLRNITSFSVNTIVTGIYWILTLLSQLGYLSHFFSKDAEIILKTANAASHFILNNLFVFAWILLWTRNFYWGSEVILIAHFISQHINSWRNRSLPAVAHLAAVAAPYAWTLIALLWNGAVAVGSSTPASKIAANVFIWAIFVLGAVHIFLAQDDLLGYCFSILTLGLALQQYEDKLIPRQWIFAFIIFAVIFIESLYITVTKYYNRNIYFRRVDEPEILDPERAPLLSDGTQPSSAPAPAT